MVTLELKEKIMRLNKKDKEEIVQIIWDEICESNISISKEHMEILEKRYQSYKKGEMQFKDWNDVKKDIISDGLQNKNFK